MDSYNSVSIVVGEFGHTLCVDFDAFYSQNIAGEANDHVSSTLISYIILW